MRHIAASSGSSGTSGVAVVVVVVIAAVAFGFWWLSAARRRPATPVWARPKATTSTQLRQDLNGTIVTDKGFLFRTRYWFMGTGCPPTQIPSDRYLDVRQQQFREPVQLASIPPRSWWMFEDSFYWESGGYSAHDMLALIRDRQRRDQQRLDRAHSMLNAEQNATPASRRGPIPRELRRMVFERDGGQCVECGSTFDLQYDHVIPVALGGATSFENLQLLCGRCNREKSANL